MSERPLAQGHPVGLKGTPPQPAPARSIEDALHEALASVRRRNEILEEQFSAVMAVQGRRDDVIKKLKRLLWREVARHRRAHRYHDAKDIETALQHIDP